MVNELVEYDHVSRVNVLPKRAAGSGGKDMGTALKAKGLHIGPVVYMRRHDTVLASVPEQRGVGGINLNTSTWLYFTRNYNFCFCLESIPKFNGAH